ncbi:hypothetical protein CMI47_19445 [Candidatus Pacearchaeota archaeon]|nr:hypothetical protein [Candidatus Pacearchaeota archaeon]|tara:strand:+ start:1940 stop:3820 length:1881 start_codon:yes stop_codon:yes gene_type:complete
MKNDSKTSSNLLNEGLLEDIISFLLKGLGVDRQDDFDIDAIRNISIDRGEWLSKGDEGGEVKNLQLILSSLGYQVEATGIFDEQTTSAVTSFQNDMGIGEDGVVGPITSTEILVKLGVEDKESEAVTSNEEEDTHGYAAVEEHRYISPVQGGRYNPNRHGSDGVQKSMDISGREDHPIVAPIDGYIDKVWWEIDYDDAQPQRKGKRGGRVIRMIGTDGLRHYFLHLSGLAGSLAGVMDSGDYRDSDTQHKIIPWGTPDASSAGSIALHGGPLLVSGHEGHSKPTVWQGNERVSQGDVIGYMGQSGISSEQWGGNHLHYHVKDAAGNKIDLNTLGLHGIRKKGQRDMSESIMKDDSQISEHDLRSMIDDELMNVLSSIISADDETSCSPCGENACDQEQDDDYLWAGGDNLEREIDWEDVVTDDDSHESSTIIKKSRGGWQHLVGEDDINECLRQLIRKTIIAEQNIECGPPQFQQGDVFVPTSKGFSFKLTRDFSSIPSSAYVTAPSSVDQTVVDLGVHSISGWVIGEYEADQALAARNISTGEETTKSSRKLLGTEEEGLATAGLCANLYWEKLRDRNDPPDNLELMSPYTVDQLRELGWRSDPPDMYDDAGRNLASQSVIPGKE